MTCEFDRAAQARISSSRSPSRSSALAVNPAVCRQRERWATRNTGNDTTWLAIENAITAVTERA